MKELGKQVFITLGPDGEPAGVVKATNANEAFTMMPPGHSVLLNKPAEPGETPDAAPEITIKEE